MAEQERLLLGAGHDAVLALTDHDKAPVRRQGRSKAIGGRVHGQLAELARSGLDPQPGPRDPGDELRIARLEPVAEVHVGPPASFGLRPDPDVQEMAARLGGREQGPHQRADRESPNSTHRRLPHHGSAPFVETVGGDCLRSPSPALATISPSHRFVLTPEPVAGKTSATPRPASGLSSPALRPGRPTHLQRTQLQKNFGNHLRARLDQWYFDRDQPRMNVALTLPWMRTDADVLRDPAAADLHEGETPCATPSAAPIAALTLYI